MLSEAHKVDQSWTAFKLELLSRCRHSVRCNPGSFMPSRTTFKLGSTRLEWGVLRQELTKSRTRYQCIPYGVCEKDDEMDKRWAGRILDGSESRNKLKKLRNATRGLHSKAIFETAWSSMCSLATHFGHAFTNATVVDFRSNVVRLIYCTAKEKECRYVPECPDIKLEFCNG